MFAPFFPGMDDDLRIGLGPESMPQTNELLPKLYVIEDLTIERDPQRSVLIRERLSASLNADDRKASMPQRAASIPKVPAAIGPTMLDPTHHPLHETNVRRTAEGQNPAYAAQLRIPHMPLHQDPD